MRRRCWNDRHGRRLFGVTPRVRNGQHPTRRPALALLEAL
jgi:hypothetical protein